MEEHNRNNRLARPVPTLIGYSRIYYVFKIKARSLFSIIFLQAQFARKIICLNSVLLRKLLFTF